MSDPKGTQLRVGDGAEPEVFTKLGNITGTNLPPTEATVKQITHLEDDSHRYRGGVKNHGQVNGTIGDLKIPNLAALKAAVGQNKNFQILVPDDVADGGPNLCTFNAVIQRVGDEQLEVDGNVTAKFSLKVSGEPVWTIE